MTLFGLVNAELTNCHRPINRWLNLWLVQLFQYIYANYIIKKNH